ncbi:glycosyltransferase [Pseudocolwellia sp. AS88]|uniref:glycosyltransferase n=1 Tax=Pseudocolwellia sp. AS88 TaxID=3063958 RepID=UPI0026EFF518|nr:glycosyltransferase [Pseudocolwellia sp. AS88]MDO7086719.1 glycosyltransferase [Pseudocolwellia sp. AS88]
MSINNKVIIGWGTGIRRSVSLSTETSMTDIQVKYIFKNKYLKPMNYIVNFFKTVLLLAKHQPKLVVVVVPPTLILYSVFLYKFLFNHKCKIVLDCHNGVLRSEWKHIPFVSYLFKKSDKVLSHNARVKEDIDSAFGVVSYVLGDPLIVYNGNINNPSETSLYLNDKINVLVPVSYAKDEPINEIINAAAILNKTHNFIMTGRYTKLFKENSVFDGVSFTGFISEEVYVSLLRQCDVVLCLTTDDKIQMCALIEAVSMNKNAVCSDNTVNNDIFSDYRPTFTRLDEESISASVMSCISNSLNTAEKIDFNVKYTKKWKQDSKEVFS